MKKMGYTSTPKILTHYHQAAETLLWHNPNITINGLPIDPKNSPFKKICDNLYYVADLYSNFNGMLYPKISIIPQGTILTPDRLNQKYNTQITHIEWENLTKQVIAQSDLHNILLNGHDHLHPALYYTKIGDPKHY
jgi:hypothetical protein